MKVSTTKICMERLVQGAPFEMSEISLETLCAFNNVMSRYSSGPWTSADHVWLH